MNKISIIVIALLVGLFSACQEKATDGWQNMDDILNNIKEPVFPDVEFNIVDYGAVPNEDSMSTLAFKKAIEACNNAGGGIVLVPEGTFLTGPIHLLSKVNLHIAEGATLLFSKNYSDYLPLVHSRFEGNDVMNYSPLIYANNQSNIAVTGKGKLDGNSDYDTWWFMKGSKNHGWKEGMPNQLEARAKLLDMADRQIPIEERIFGEGHYLRPSFINFMNCRNILIQDITINRSPMWEIHPVLSENITVRGVKIVSHGPNNDGCDPEACKNVLIEDCYFDTGDDCIAIKSGREEDGRRDNIPSENIIVRNCQMKDGHGGVVVGSEISGGCRNVFVENCKMDSPNLDRALRIKTNSLRGGVIENIYMRNCEIGEVKQAVLLVNFYYEQGDAGKQTPIVRNIYMDNITSAKSKYAVYLHGYERSPISNIFISNSAFSGVEKEVFIENANDINFDKVKINSKPFLFK